MGMIIWIFETVLRIFRLGWERKGEVSGWGNGMEMEIEKGEGYEEID